jgi:hypothetical protein
MLLGISFIHIVAIFARPWAAPFAPRLDCTTSLHLKTDNTPYILNNLSLIAFTTSSTFPSKSPQEVDQLAGATPN